MSRQSPQSPPTAAEELARFAVNTELAELPTGAVEATKALLLDALGVGIVGRTTPESRRVADVAATWGQAAEAHVWGGGPTLPAPSASLVNAHQLHCLEFDAIHEPAVVHPLTVVVPVLVAWMEREQAAGRRFSGQELLAGVAVGVEVAARLGDVTTTPLRFFRPGTAGGLGAVAALAAVAKPDVAFAADALGVAYGHLCGTMQAHTEGAQVLALQVGFNARGALSSWDLTEAGFEGPRAVLDGPFGYFGLIETAGDVERLLSGLGSTWEVTRTSFKPFPSGRATHAGIDGVLRLQKEAGFVLEDIESVCVRVPPMVHRLVGRSAEAGMEPGAARLCLAFLIPSAVVDGTVDASAYRPERLDDPSILGAAQRVSVVADDNQDPNAFDPQTVEVRLRDGRRLEIELAASLGSPAVPFERSQQLAKLQANLSMAGRERVLEPLVELVDELDTLDDVAPVLRLL